ncbi:MAG: hypothetical protein IKY98_03665, partial [Alphaproteobacteria bacterium]|nr:hypothetical protein [Alphaproteobacteria bacterium]
CDGDEKEILFALNEAVLGNMDETGAGCQADSDCSADKPYCDTATGVCHECVSNDDCGAGQFCADSNESASKATPYTCKSLNFSTVDLTNEEGVTETWHYSNEPMSWWDTKMACDAMDLRMPTLSELSSGDANSAGNYKIVRPHIKTLYNLIKKSNNPSILITGCHTYLSIDGWMPNCNQKPYNLLTEPTYGVCKE